MEEKEEGKQKRSQSIEIGAKIEAETDRAFLLNIDPINGVYYPPIWIAKKHVEIKERKYRFFITADVPKWIFASWRRLKKQEIKRWIPTVIL